MQDYISEFFGIKTATLIAAFVGSSISLSYMPELTRWQLVTALFTGIAMAVYGAPMMIHLIEVLSSVWGHPVKIPEVFERGFSFFIALLSMRLVPVMFSLVDRLKGARLPFIPDSKE